MRISTLCHSVSPMRSMITDEYLAIWCAAAACAGCRERGRGVLDAMKDLKLAGGRDRLVRHGHGPTRTIQTGIGAVEVERVKIWDRGATGDGERVRFTSALLPLWAGRDRDWNI